MEILRAVRVKNGNVDYKLVRVRRSNGELLAEFAVPGALVDQRQGQTILHPSEAIWPDSPWEAPIMFTKRSDCIIELGDMDNMEVELRWK